MRNPLICLKVIAIGGLVCVISYYKFSKQKPQVNDNSSEVNTEDVWSYKKFALCRITLEIMVNPVLVNGR